MYVREVGLKYREKEQERHTSVHVTREITFIIVRPVYYHVRKTNRVTTSDGRRKRSRKCYVYNINNSIYKRYIDHTNIFCSELNFYLYVCVYQ